MILLNEPERVEFPDMLPCSAYQNSVSWKLSRTCSCIETQIHGNKQLARKSSGSTKMFQRVDKDRLTTSIASSFLSAGRLIEISDRGRFVRIWKKL